MASEGLNLDGLSSESKDVLQIINEGDDFLLSGGAGSGKTYSLIEIVRSVLELEPLKCIACITYTNAAVAEIESKIEHQNLYATTIHEFLWGNIKLFQDELKSIIIELIIDDDYPRFKNKENVLVDGSYYDDLDRGIQYKEFVRLKDGIISHDELIVVAKKMYEKYPKLCSITKDKYPYIFVDEYQDTERSVIEILLQDLNQSDKPNIVGFFGDAMQSIYDGSIGNLDEYKGDGELQVREVKKEQNRRNPQLIIDLANHLRTDGLRQHPSEDISAPNMNSDGVVKSGSVLFLYSSNDNLNNVREYLDWDFNDAITTKELNLTHNLIASKAGFGELMRIYDGDKILDYVLRIKKYIKENVGSVITEGKTFGDVIGDLKNGKIGRELKSVSPTKGMQEYIDHYPVIYEEALNSPYEIISSMYVDKDQLVDDKKNDVMDEGKINSSRDDLIRHLFKIQHNVRLYEEQRISEFLRHTDFNLSNIDSKKRLKDKVEALTDVGDKTIRQIIDEANNSGIAVIDDRLQRFIEKKKYIYQQVEVLPFSQFQRLYDYLEGFTPFTTKHKTKGAEFPFVLVILDNGRWNHYNFESLFTGSGSESVLTRTQKIFYVCCTRAKEKLAVFYHQPTSDVITKAKEWFGEENVRCLD